ncbi:ATP-dependent zinc metalloprotease FtsH [Gossypium australe]|uniref:ATP-dependent zinc metalloprotease FtsH n=1 Tax=Gossypium australe TaxID=47621 RepID=A0A5B6WNS1_9ROSI|nr:ATP-dependent zinc metalloprotease FtsH [Gossypium australe]
MLRILEKVAGPNSGSGGRRSVTERLRSNGAELFREIKGCSLLVSRRSILVVSKYVGANYVDTRRCKFLNLTQGDRSLAEYKAEFLRLSRYARGMVALEYERCIHFADGLRDNLRREREFTVLVEKAKFAEDVKPVECQNMNKERGKNKRDLEPSNSVLRPKKKARSDGPVRVATPIASIVPIGLQPCSDCGIRHLTSVGGGLGLVQALASGPAQPQRVVQQPPRGRGQAKGGNSMGRGQRAPGRVAGQTEARQPALIYAARRREDRDASDVITDMSFIFNVPYLALIDIGSTHSYITSAISENLGISIESTTSESIRVSKMYMDVPLVVHETIFLANLMELPFGEFNLILGMEWLIKRRGVLRTEGDEEVVVIGELRDYLSDVISALVAEKLVQKGCEAYLAYVSVSDSGDSSIGNIRTVKDFPGVFLEELSGLPPN